MESVLTLSLSAPSVRNLLDPLSRRGCGYIWEAIISLTALDLQIETPFTVGSFGLLRRFLTENPSRN